MAKPVLYTPKMLLEVIPRGETWLSAARHRKVNPLKFTHGDMTELPPVLDWIAANPDFRIAQVWRRSAKKKDRKKTEERHNEGTVAA
jgi:hypothetical protein